jgi:hypothetical protein
MYQPAAVRQVLLLNKMPRQQNAAANLFAFLFHRQ